MKGCILILLSLFVILIVVAQPVKKSIENANTNITDYEVSRSSRSLSFPRRHCGIFHYYDEEEGRCMAAVGGGKALYIDRTKSCGIDVLKPHCSNPRYYYMCKKGKTILAQCPNNRHFEDLLQKCIFVPHYEYVSVIVQPNSDASQMVQLPSCKEAGTFAVPGDCSLFYTCMTFEIHQTFYRCPKYMAYDPEAEMCSPSSTCEKSELYFSCSTIIKGENMTLEEAGKLPSLSKPFTVQQSGSSVSCATMYTSGDETTTMNIRETTGDKTTIRNKGDMDNDDDGLKVTTASYTKPSGFADNEDVASTTVRAPEKSRSENADDSATYPTDANTYEKETNIPAKENEGTTKTAEITESLITATATAVTTETTNAATTEVTITAITEATTAATTEAPTAATSEVTITAITEATTAATTETTITAITEATTAATTEAPTAATTEAPTAATTEAPTAATTEATTAATTEAPTAATTETTTAATTEATTAAITETTTAATTAATITATVTAITEATTAATTEATTAATITAITEATTTATNETTTATTTEATTVATTKAFTEATTAATSEATITAITETTTAATTEATTAAIATATISNDTTTASGAGMTTSESWTIVTITEEPITEESKDRHSTAATKDDFSKEQSTLRNDPSNNAEMETQANTEASSSKSPSTNITNDVSLSTKKSLGDLFPEVMITPGGIIGEAEVEIATETVKDELLLETITSRGCILDDQPSKSVLNDVITSTNEEPERNAKGTTSLNIVNEDGSNESTTTLNDVPRSVTEDPDNLHGDTITDPTNLVSIDPEENNKEVAAQSSVEDETTASSIPVNEDAISGSTQTSNDAPSSLPEEPNNSHNVTVLDPASLASSDPEGNGNTDITKLSAEDGTTDSPTINQDPIYGSTVTLNDAPLNEESENSPKDTTTDSTNLVSIDPEQNDNEVAMQLSVEDETTASPISFNENPINRSTEASNNTPPNLIEEPNNLGGDEIVDPRSAESNDEDTSSESNVPRTEKTATDSYDFAFSSNTDAANYFDTVTAISIAEAIDQFRKTMSEKGQIKENVATPLIKYVFSSTPGLTLNTNDDSFVGNNKPMPSTSLTPESISSVNNPALHKNTQNDPSTGLNIPEINSVTAIRNELSNRVRPAISLEELLANCAARASAANNAKTAKEVDLTNNGEDSNSFHKHLHSWITDKKKAFGHSVAVGKEEYATAPKLIHSGKTISKNVALPIASAVLNITDKFERHMKNILSQLILR